VKDSGFVVRVAFNAFATPPAPRYQIKATAATYGEHEASPETRVMVREIVAVFAAVTAEAETDRLTGGTERLLDDRRRTDRGVA
jgi:hypothetical protein